MRLYSIRLGEEETAALATTEGLLPLRALNLLFKTSWPETVWDILQMGVLNELRTWFNNLSQDDLKRTAKEQLKRTEVLYCPLYRHPGKIWGIGLNYPAHAADLSARTPQELPAGFIKADTTIIGPGDSVRLPLLSQKVTGEAELGLVIGSEIKNLDSEKPLRALAGFVSIIDMTAEDILRKNPRYLTLSKNFNTFISLGPQLVTVDEIPHLEDLKISTLLNGQVAAENTVSEMTFSPAFLIRFLAKVMTLQPGDIISSGTPGAAALRHGDRIECRINGFEPLRNPVIDLKRR